MPQNPININWNMLTAAIKDTLYIVTYSTTSERHKTITKAIAYFFWPKTWTQLSGWETRVQASGTYFGQALCNTIKALFDKSVSAGDTEVVNDVANILFCYNNWFMVWPQYGALHQPNDALHWHQVQSQYKMPPKGFTPEDHIGQNTAKGLKAAWDLNEEKIVCITPDNTHKVRGWE